MKEPKLPDFDKRSKTRAEAQDLYADAVTAYNQLTMKPTPGFTSSLNPPMVTAEVEKTCGNCIWFRSFREAYDDDKMEPEDQGWCWQNEPNDKGRFHEGVDIFDRCKDQEYHKAIKPMPVENAHKIESSGYTFVLFAKYGDPFTLKLHQKVEFIKTETGCRITKIVNQ